MYEVSANVNHGFLHVACAKGWKLFPIAAGTKDKPLSKWRHGGPGEVAACDPTQITAWSQRWPDCNWGIATGSTSGVFVVDTDGFEAWLFLAGKGVAETFTVKTGNPDNYRLQYYFRVPEGMKVKTSASEIAPGLDIRGEGGMVVAPGSMHPSGNLYTVQEDCPVADAPAWLLELVVDQSAPRVPVAPVGELTEGQRQSGLAIFKSCLAKYAEVKDGEWNTRLTSLTFLAGRMAAAGVFTEDEVEEMMMACPTVEAYYAEKPRVVVANFASGFATGGREPWDGAEAEAEQLERAGFGKAPLPPGASVTPVMSRAERIAENIRIGEGSDEHMRSETLTLDQMFDRFVYITEMESVQDLQYPRNILSFSAFTRDQCGSKTEKVIEGEWGPKGVPKTKVFPTAKLWAEGLARRKKALTLTFRPDAPVLTEDPEGKLAANTWRPIERKASAGSCEIFLNHVDYLFAADAPRFLDWLAHIEQNPGVLPHSGWVHVSPSQGTGRNWISSVLCRLWRGLVSPNFDLAGTLASGFNGRLSHKLLAVVDEIEEGGSDAKWGNAQALKSIITTDTRSINPKYGHQRLEHNACRWLIFSNHESALPLTEADRRFNVVRNDSPPMPDSYYVQLYAALNDRRFIDAVAWMLKTRDIASFNPGAHAVMNAAKREMIGASKTETDDIIEDLVANYALDVITSADLGMKLNNGQGIKGHHTYALRRAGVKPYGKPIHHGGKMVRVSVLRNWAKWEHASLDNLREELKKAAIPEWKG
jgi:Bifunctional DNA primase/polymerase, N-terminal/Family of unknown function (DUF5906)